MDEPVEIDPEEPSGDAVEDLLTGVTRLAIACTAIAVSAVSSLVRGPDQSDEESDEELPEAWALLSVGLELERRGFEMAATAISGGLKTATSIFALFLPAGVKDQARRRVSAMSSEGRDELKETQDNARRSATALLDSIVDAVLDRIDFDRMIDGVDLNAILERVDVNAVVRRIELDPVLANIDIDRIVRRIDAEAVLRRVDLAGLARDVMDELDVEEIIRDSAGSLAVETVDAVRVQGMGADRAVSRFVDRLVGRKGEREIVVTDVDGGPEER